MVLNDIRVSRLIVEQFSKKLLDSLESDVAVVGGGPAGLTAAYYLAKKGAKVTLFERKLSIGGGMWGGGIMFNEIVIQQKAKKILDEFGVKTKDMGDGYYCADSVETVSTICSKASKAGVKIFNLMSAEDVMLTKGKVSGLVINWSAVEIAGLHVDPITVGTKYVVDATGHPAEIAHILQDKNGCKLSTKTGKILGEKEMNAETGEKKVLENTKEIYPGVYSCGMCCNAIFGDQRMGPIFGGMLMSGEKVAGIISEKIGK